MGGRGGGFHPAGGISTLMQMLVFWCWMCNQEVFANTPPIITLLCSAAPARPKFN